MNNRYKQMCRAIKLVSASYEQWVKMYAEHIVFERRHWKMDDGKPLIGADEWRDKV